jgi:hypothetical protein
MTTESHGAKTTATLIAGLETGATLVDTGKFSVDLPRAVELMGSLALLDPSLWLALVVQSGVLMGGRMVDIHWSEAECLVVIAGVDLPPTEMSDPWSMSGVAGTTTKRSALQKLMLAYATLLAQGAKSIEVRSSGHRAVYRMGESTLDATATDEGTRILVEFGAASKAIRSETVTSTLRERCILSETNIAFDGESQTVGWHAFLDANTARVDVTDANGAVIGMAGFKGGHAHPAVVAVLVGGLFVEHVELPLCDAGFVAVIDHDLPLDLSQRKLVRGEHLDEVLRRIMAAYSAAPRPTALPQTIARAGLADTLKAPATKFRHAIAIVITGALMLAFMTLAGTYFPSWIEAHPMAVYLLLGFYPLVRLAHEWLSPSERRLPARPRGGSTCNAKQPGDRE